MTEIEIKMVNGKPLRLYRELETGLYKFSCDAVDFILEALEEIQQYRALGTVEELRVARDKQVAKKPFEDKENSCFWTCPTCRNEIYWDTDYGQQKFNHCSWCGQKLDWSDEDEKE